MICTYDILMPVSSLTLLMMTSMLSVTGMVILLGILFGFHFEC
jgi:hypothetical protein